MVVAALSKAFMDGILSSPLTILPGNTIMNKEWHQHILHECLYTTLTWHGKSDKNKSQKIMKS